jgi:hypothetical protein
MNSIALQGTIYKLPLTSTLQLRAHREQLKTQFDLLKTMWSSSVGATPSYSQDTLTTNTNSFDGDIVNTSASAVWRGEISGTDFDVNYRNIVRENNSNTVSFTGNGTATTTGKFAYNRQNMGFDLGRKVAARTKVKFAYDNDYVSRTDRPDGTSSRDNRYKLGVKNTDWDMLNVNATYEKLIRTSEFSASKGNYNDYRRYGDVTEKNSDAVKLEFNSTPKENLDITIGGKSGISTYPETFLGLQSENDLELFLDVSYNMPDVMKVVLFVDSETYNRTGQHYKGAAGDNPTNFTPATNSKYLWDDSWVDRNYWYGVNFIIPIIEDKMTTQIGIAREESTGEVNFNYINNVGPTIMPTNISNFGNYKKTTLTLKVDYNLKKNLRAGFAGILESLDGDDIQIAGYQNLIQTSNKYMIFSGAGADNSYDKVYAVQASLAYDF